MNTSYPVTFTQHEIIALLNDKKSQFWQAKRPSWKPCDVLWLQEKFTINALADSHISISYYARKSINDNEIFINRDDAVNDFITTNLGKPFTWRKAADMPRWMSRIELKVTGIREASLANVTIIDIVANGYNNLDDFYVAWDEVNCKRPCSTKPKAYITEFTKIPRGDG